MISETFFTAGPRKTHELHSSCSTQTRNRGAHVAKIKAPKQWRRQEFVTGGGVRYGSIGGLEYEVLQSVCLSVYQRGSLLDGLAMCLSCDTKKFHDNESTHIGLLHNFWTSTDRGEASALAAPLHRRLRGLEGWRMRGEGY